MLNNQQQNEIPQKEMEQNSYQEPQKSIFEKLNEFISTCPLTIFTIILMNIIIMFLNFLCYSNQCFDCFIRTMIILFAWAPLGKKIENSVGSGRYICLTLLNSTIVFCIYNTIIYYRYYFSEILYNFAYFEMLLVALSNKDKHILILNKKISCKFIIIVLPILSLFIIYHHMYFIITYIYGWIYHKYLIEKLSFSDEKIKKLESSCILRRLIKCKRYVKLPEVNNLIDASIQINMNGINNNIEVQPQQVVINNNTNQNNNMTNNMSNNNEFITPGYLNINQV